MKFILMLFTLLSASAFAQDYSYANCGAYTTCWDGSVISCDVFGSQAAFGNYSTECSWQAIQARSVNCSGYVAQRDFYGTLHYKWVNKELHCPARSSYRPILAPVYFPLPPVYQPRRSHYRHTRNIYRRRSRHYRRW